ncbi:DUF1963 domain-containing protein [Tabrizicola aquatica]|uniref:DUF1963 domain-containing protein n=1 Tax=Tabrizicola aquatica TaxID=909926 RepID=UPI0015E17A1A|nr:DUF1963 domain-containing protein [Tabrizicola aquatica]
MKALALVVALPWFVAGIWLYVLKELETVPMGTLGWYVLIWLGIPLIPVAILVLAVRNPFNRMTAEERERVIGIVRQLSVNEPVTPADTTWMVALFKKYGGGRKETDMFRLLKRAIRNELPAIQRERQAAEGAHDGPSIVLARRRRGAGFDPSRDGTSWFGGLPALGDMTWPLDDEGRPMTPLAQIDLTGLAAHLQVPGLPAEGSLAFFAALPEKGEWVGRVRHVAGPVGATTKPPGALRPVEDHTVGGPLRRGEPGDGQLLFPRMALELVPVHGKRAEQKAEVERVLGPARHYNLDATLFKEAFSPDRPFNRDSLLRFLHGAKIALGAGEKAEAALRKMQASYTASEAALVAKLETATEGREEMEARLQGLRTALGRLERNLADFPAAVAALAAERDVMETWARTGDRWAPLTEAEQETLAPLLAPWTEHRGLGHVHLDQCYGIHRRMGDCVSETLLVMAVAEDRVFAALPQPVQEAVNGAWRQPYDRGFHQMFGEPDSVQDAASTYMGYYLLLQLQCDDLAGFHWGDAGVLQFWLRPADLEAGRWDRVTMSFEGH